MRTAITNSLRIIYFCPFDANSRDSESNFTRGPSTKMRFRAPTSSFKFEMKSHNYYTIFDTEYINYCIHDCTKKYTRVCTYFVNEIRHRILLREFVHHFMRGTTHVHGSGQLYIRFRSHHLRVDDGISTAHTFPNRPLAPLEVAHLYKTDHLCIKYKRVQDWRNHSTRYRYLCSLPKRKENPCFFSRRQKLLIRTRLQKVG